MEQKTFYKIRFNDCDSFRHLNNSGFIDYMLNAREDHLFEFHDISMTELYKKGAAWMVNRHEIVYLAPAMHGEQVCIQSDLIKLSDDSLFVEMIMWDKHQKQVKAILWTKFIHFDLKTGKRDKHPQWFMELAAPLEKANLQGYSINERISMLVKQNV